MTKEEFNGKFKGVNGPSYRGAPMPKFNPTMVNESEFPDELRFKEYDFDFTEGGEGSEDTLDITWISQVWECTDKLIAEIKRCLKHIGFVGTVYLNIRMRGERQRSKYAESHTFKIEKGEMQ